MDALWEKDPTGKMDAVWKGKNGKNKKKLLKLFLASAECRKMDAFWEERRPRRNGGGKMNDEKRTFLGIWRKKERQHCKEQFGPITFKFTTQSHFRAFLT